MTSLFQATGGDPLKGQTNTTQPKETGPQEVQHQFQTKTKTTSQFEEKCKGRVQNVFKHLKRTTQEPRSYCITGNATCMKIVPTLRAAISVFMRKTDAGGACVSVCTCIYGQAECVCVRERIEAGTLRGPSERKKTGIRASSKSSEFVEEASAI